VSDDGVREPIELCLAQAKAFEKLREAYLQLEALKPVLRSRYEEVRRASEMPTWKDRDREYHRAQMEWHGAFVEFRKASMNSAG
jgi:hypothetical protein